MSDEKFDALLQQVTRMADALHLQTELQLKNLEKAGSAASDSSCRDLIAKTNQMARSMKAISDGVDDVNAGKMQTIDATVSAVTSVEDAGARSTSELDLALGSLQGRTSRNETIVNDIISHLAPHSRGALPLHMLEQLEQIEQNPPGRKK